MNTALERLLVKDRRIIQLCWQHQLITRLATCLILPVAGGAVEGELWPPLHRQELPFRSQRSPGAQAGLCSSLRRGAVQGFPQRARAQQSEETAPEETPFLLRRARTGKGFVLRFPWPLACGSRQAGPWKDASLVVTASNSCTSQGKRAVAPSLNAHYKQAQVLHCSIVE